MALRATAPRDPNRDVQALSEQHTNQREVGPLQAVALGPSEAVALTWGLEERSDTQHCDRRCVGRLVATTSAIDDDDRVVVDAHGWPRQVPVSDEWRRQIDIAAKRSPGPPRITPRERGVLASPAGSLVVELVRDEDGRLWADAWDSRETVPTSFRLVESEPKRYDVMRAKNNTLRFADPSRPLPGWCAWAVAEAIARL